jgi:membrane protein required for colicin V production
VAWTLGPSVANYYEHWISLPSARIAAGYGTCFVAVLLLGALVRFLVARLVAGTGLSGTDRLLGMVFGFVRGVLLVTLGVFLMGFTPFTRDPWYQDSVLLPQFKGVAAWLGERVPDSVREHLNHPPALLDHLPALPASIPGALPATGHEIHPTPATTVAPATSS